MLDWFQLNSVNSSNLMKARVLITLAHLTFLSSLRSNFGKYYPCIYNILDISHKLFHLYNFGDDSFCETTKQIKLFDGYDMFVFSIIREILSYKLLPVQVRIH